VALLRLLHAEARRKRLKLAAAHVNYNLRGSDSTEDESFCRSLCDKLGIELHVKIVKKRSAAGNLQQWARDLRYQFFHQLMDEKGYQVTALGHNRDDNIETIIMNLARGAGSFGLSGMPEAGAGIVRPLLECSRADIESYLVANNFSFRIDRSNLEGKYLRNKVRQELVPQLRELFGDSVEKNIHRSASIFAEHEAFLRQFAEDRLEKDASRTAFGKFVLDLTRVREYHPLIARVVIALCYEQLRGSLTGFEYSATERVLSLIVKGSGRADLVTGVTAEVCRDALYLMGDRIKPKSIKVAVSGDTKLKTYGMILNAELLAGSAKSPRPSIRELRSGANKCVYLDATKLPSDLRIRGWRRADRFRPLGAGGSKTLADFFTDRKIDRPLREEIPLLCGRSSNSETTLDEIVWVVGQEIGDRYKITEKTTKIVKLEVVPYRGI